MSNVLIITGAVLGALAGGVFGWMLRDYLAGVE